MSPSYIQETVLAMELDRSHIGRLVQVITEEWSITGTLKRVDQHDNKEWDLDGRPRVREIYTDVTVGPWTGRLVGDQPVTVETVKGSLEAPERAAELTVYADGDRAVGLYVPDPKPWARIEWEADLPPAPEDWPDLPGQ